ncbi:hypothetical protein AVEN_9400-1 [Araneus ventricosus]|uniref:DUF7153 domain-containing protein n=1 Tax=Araneus ventricosus TaxID=182803 RepID=A0A4Y2DLE0_ARAVE|nr:hypothetical protein AVEN_9400-1 [Araneus ventricosus]
MNRLLEDEKFLGCIHFVSEHLSIMSDLTNRAAIFSFIAVKEELPYNTQKYFLAKGFQSNTFFEHGELLDTFEKRAFYPMVHCFTKPRSEVKDLVLLKANALGEEFILKQGVYVESKSHHNPRPINDPAFKDDTAYIFMGFKSVDLTYNENLEQSWKDWTGARLVNSCLRNEFYINRYSFFHRIQPPDPELFMYVLMIECHNVNNSNVTYLLDFVQKLRVERVFGYLTVYRREALASTSAIIKGILSEQDEYGGKVDI